MDIRSTKTQEERQEEEAKRLVRPAPKYKPPRHDRRRERDNSDQDVDPDEAADRKDRSDNFKDVGGSTTRVVVARYLWAMEFATKDELKKYLEEHPGADPSKHSVKEESQAAPKEEEGGEEKPPAKEEEKAGEPKEEKPVNLAEIGGQLHLLGKKDKALGAQLKLFQPGGFYDGMAKEDPDFDISRLPWSKALPEELRGLSLGDIRDALMKAPAPTPKGKGKKSEPPEAQPSEPSGSDVTPNVGVPEANTKPDAGVPEAIPDANVGVPEEGPPEAQEPAKVPKKPKIPQPHRPDASQPEKVRSYQQLEEVFGEDTAKHLAKLHPQDAATLVDMYQAVSSAIPKNIQEYAGKVADFYETDPNKVPPPKMGQDESGDLVPFETLSPEEQGESYRRHQLRTVAISMAAERNVRDAIAKTLPKTASGIAGALAAAMLQPKNEHRAAWAGKAASASFEHAVAEGGAPIPAKDVHKLLATLGDNEDAKRIAVGYLQGQDYTAAKNLFLNTNTNTTSVGGAAKKALGWAVGTAEGAVKLLWDLLVDDDNSSTFKKPEAEAAEEVVNDYTNITEHSSPKQIGQALRGVDNFMKLREKNYPEELLGEFDPAAMFRQQVLSRVKSLTPNKYPEVRALLEEHDFTNYEHKQAEFEDKEARWEQEKDLHLSQNGQQGPKKPDRGKFSSDEAFQQAMESYHQLKDESRAAAWTWEQENPHPKAPLKPANYDRMRNPKALKDMQKWLLAEQAAHHGGKTAARVVERYVISSYPSPSSMASVSEKAAVYNGVAPYPNTPGYTPWSQPAQRDLGDGDFEVILKGAQEWLDTPVLKYPLENTVRDIQLRAALDLSIYHGPYNGGIQPNTYNMLLARLAGVDEHATLLTIRKQAGYSYATDRMTVAMWGKHPLNRDVLDAIPDAEVLFDDDEGKPHQENPLKVSDHKSGTMLNHVEEGQGLLREFTVSVTFPKGADQATLVALKGVARKFGLQLEKVEASYKPTSRGERKQPKEYRSPLLRGRQSNEEGSQKVANMKASTELRKMAAKYAAENAPLAYELMDLASRLAQDQGQQEQDQGQKQAQDQQQQGQGQEQEKQASKYASLRSTVITAATKSPEARTAFMPILQAIKSLDV